MKYDILITVLSWEDRYILGLEKDVTEYTPSYIILFKYNNPLTKDWKNRNLKLTRALAGSKIIEVEIDSLKQDDNWFIFLKVFSENCKNKSVLLDSTTMTREAIFLSLYNCKLNNCNTAFIYYKPNSYPGDWISRDPGKPRLLYKMSGIAKLGAPTLLLVTCGFDIERLDNLIYRFEPRTTLVFLADGKSQRNKDNSDRCKNLLVKKYNIKSFYEYDPYDVESSYKLILEKLLQEKESISYLDSHNIILNSLGAKLSAITLFNIWLKYPQVALSYIPSREYNKEYSSGIGQHYNGNIHF